MWMPMLKCSHGPNFCWRIHSYKLEQQCVTHRPLPPPPGALTLLTIPSVYPLSPHPIAYCTNSHLTAVLRSRYFSHSARNACISSSYIGTQAHALHATHTHAQIHITYLGRCLAVILLRTPSASRSLAPWKRRRRRRRRTKGKGLRSHRRG